MKTFLKLYEEENKDELSIDEFNETIDKLKDVFNNADPVQTGAVMLCDIIKKIVDDSDNQQDLIDSFKTQLDSVLESTDTEATDDTTDEPAIDFDEKFDEMNDLELDDPGEATADDNIVDQDEYKLDSVEANSKEEKFANLKKVTGAKKSGKDKKEEAPAEE
jgi:hypothetical protein